MSTEWSPKKLFYYKLKGHKGVEHPRKCWSDQFGLLEAEGLKWQWFNAEGNTLAYLRPEQTNFGLIPNDNVSNGDDNSDADNDVDSDTMIISKYWFLFSLFVFCIFFCYASHIFSFQN